MPRWTGAVLFLATASFCVGCDHATKVLARAALSASGRLVLAHDFVRLELTTNRGGFLSLGAQLPPAVRELFFVLLVPLLLVVAGIALLRAGSLRRSQAAALGLFVGGGAANWIDRLLHAGAVTDFVSMGIGPLRTGVFNAADVAIMMGAGLFVLAGWQPRNAKDQAAP
jgi:signal peptidase II